ncbi:MarR family winged helix-turn-helix transcriptional regulator [Actinokineospora sp. G85]|uniref:MarR family winged helix-turn-helix transcriptional regulator n=1 Tax=Actinokineospora sp. G85 TaxID=3406626 RepID=UPI003C78FDDF
MAQDTGDPMDRLGLLLAQHGAGTDTRIRAALGVTGLTPRQAMTLMFLGRGPTSQQALVDMLEVDPSVLVSILNDLERGGQATRRRDPADRRRHIVEITPEGLAALRATGVALDAVEEELFADFSARERATLHKLLNKIRTADDYDC